MKKVFVWSGGYDSTYMLYQYLIEENNPEAECFILNWNKINQRKQSQERLRQTKFIELMKSKGKNIITHFVSLDHDIQPYGEDVTMQAAMFIPLFAYLTPCKEIELNFGFIKGDDYWFAKRDYDYVIQQYCYLLHKTVTLNHPIRLLSKTDIMERVRKLGLEEYAWTCEFPDLKDKDMIECGKCKPCWMKSEANILVDHRMKESVEVKKDD
jgi:7-cyano-7-deazaguanine synthase in queuosine biosynthesis